MKAQFIRWTVPVALLCCVVIRGSSHEGKDLGQQSLPSALKDDSSRPKVQFTDVTARAGLTFRHVTGHLESKEYILESTGSGLALIDYNKDGFLDIFLVNGTTLAGFPPGQEPTNHLYHNNGDGTFKDVTQKANLVRTGWGQGVCAGDYDNDGNDDLVVTYYGQNILYRNTGRGSFADVTARAGLLHKVTRWNTGCSFLDYDKDGNLDLFVANYITLDLKRSMSKASENCRFKKQIWLSGRRKSVITENSR